MKVNEGSVDRVVRVVLAAVLFYLVFAGVVTGVWAWVAGIAGAIALITGATGFCAIYALLGIRTCPAPKAKA